MALVRWGCQLLSGKGSGDLVVLAEFDGVPSGGPEGRSRLLLLAIGCGEMASVRRGCQAAINQRKRLPVVRVKLEGSSNGKAVARAVMTSSVYLSVGWFRLAEITKLMMHGRSTVSRYIRVSQVLCVSP
jgi:hypothetical protein